MANSITNTGSISNISTIAFTVGGCFLAGSRISTPQGDREIETLILGDKVIAHGEGSPVAEILNIIVINESGYYELMTRDRSVQVTAEHPFFTDEGLVRVADLEIGDSLVTINGMEPITSKSYIEGQVQVFNLQVTEPNTYYSNGFAVHNKP